MGRRLHLVTERLVGLFLQEFECVVGLHPEDLWRLGHALRIAFADFPIHNDFHSRHTLPFTVKRVFEAGGRLMRRSRNTLC